VLVGGVVVQDEMDVQYFGGLRDQRDVGTSETLGGDDGAGTRQSPRR
jgi:hypothetical protein